jgi:predicted RNA-binding protein (virulence factor B family)
MIQAGHYYKLKIVKFVEFGAYLDAEGTEILLPKRYVPKQAKEGDEVEVFLYHDNESRIIATTDKPIAIAGELALMKAVDKNKQGAFLEWGIMKDLFLPLSQQRSRIYIDHYYLVYLYVDEMTGRMAATEKFEKYLSNETLTVKETEAVTLLVWEKTDIGYKVIINNKHIGVLHFNEVFRDLEYGERIKGFIKTIRPDNKIDVSAGERGYKRISGEAERIIALLKEHNDYLPYNDKSSPEEIYDFFGISKKSFKMALGTLYKQRIIELTQTGIKRIDLS